MQAEGRDKSAILGKVPKVDAENAKSLYTALSNAIEKGLVASCQPVGLGGLGIALAKKCIAGQLGASIDLSKAPMEHVDRNDSMLFSESQTRLVATIAPENKEAFEEAMKGTGFAEIGVIAGDKLEIKGLDGKEIVSCSLPDLEEAYKKTLRDY